MRFASQIRLELVSVNNSDHGWMKVMLMSSKADAVVFVHFRLKTEEIPSSLCLRYSE